MRSSGASLVFLLFASSLSADTYPRQPGVDVQHYTFRVTLSDDSDAISGETTVTVRFLRDGLAEWSLDLASPANGKGMTVTEVSSGGAPVEYTHQSDRLRMTLRPPAKAGELRQFTVKYHGVPAGGLLAVNNKFGDRCFFSVNWPDMAHQWLPTIDHPYDKATSEFIVTAPAKYQVVANGLLYEQIDLGDGRRATGWKQAVPIATWLDQIGVAQFASRHFGKAAGVPLQTWLFPRDRDAGIVTLEEPTRQAIEFFRDHVGPYPYEKLAGVEAAGMSGGMEVASAIFYGERAITGRPAFSLVAHETAHQWFGDSVTEKDWDDVWLSEGFATYFALLATEHYAGREAFAAGLNASRARIFTAEKRLPGVAVVEEKPWTGIPNQIVYQKGGWALHMLRGEIGTEKFWAGIREYYRRFRDGNASTADFEKVMEEISGADLRWFFRQWLYRAGSPVVEGTWHYDAAAKKVEIELAQTEAGEPYRLPIEIGLVESPGAAPTIAPIEMTGKQQKFAIAMEKEPASVGLDPHTWLLMDARFARK
jgi:aminopeptidase N